VLSALEGVGCDAPGSDRILLAKEEVERIEKAIADDKVVVGVLDGLRAEMSPSEIRKDLRLTVTEFETAMKRLRRRVRRAAGQGGSDG
jgi:hypothetical protein